MKKKLVLKISVLSFVVLVIFSVISCAVLAYNDNKILSESMMDLASTYAQALEVSDPDTLVKQDKVASTRITVIDISGKVIADTYGGMESMDNHLDREEIVNARSSGNDKVVRRYSDTANTELMYYAVKVTSGGEDYYLRVSMRTADMTVYLATTVTIVVIATLTLTLVVYLLAGKFAKTTMRPLGELAINLKAVSEGKYSPIMPHEDSDEMNMLISKVNDIGELLADNHRMINLERDKLGYLLQNMSQAVIALNGSDEVMFHNERAEQLFGASTAMSASIVSAIHERDILVRYKALPSPGGEMFIWEKNDCYYRVAINKLDRTDRDLRAIILISDITKLKLAELERKQFFANCSHELKTPLTSIKGYGELVAAGIVSGDKALAYTGSIVKEADGLLAMINDMLILSRLDENIDSGEKKELDLVREINLAIASCKYKIDEKKINVSVVGEGKAYLSQENMSTIFINILSNAVKYNSTSGRIDINITQSASKTTVKIKDSGIGISAKDLPRVTERFYRADASRQGDSSGLGLAIVKHLCINNSIKLTINSKLGEGTEITLIFTLESRIKED